MIRLTTCIGWHRLNPAIPLCLLPHTASVWWYSEKFGHLFPMSMQCRHKITSNVEHCFVELCVDFQPSTGTRCWHLHCKKLPANQCPSTIHSLPNNGTLLTHPLMACKALPYMYQANRTCVNPAYITVCQTTCMLLHKSLLTSLYKSSPGRPS